MAVNGGNVVGRIVRGADIFYQSQLTIGAEFGSAMKALFIFSNSIVTSNILLFLLWIPAWIPQVLFVNIENPVSEFFSVLDTASANRSAEILQTPRNGILFFSGARFPSPDACVRARDRARAHEAPGASSHSRKLPHPSQATCPRRPSPPMLPLAKSPIIRRACSTSSAPLPRWWPRWASTPIGSASR